jgi:hypothetical protein
MKPLPNQLDLFGPRRTAHEQYGMVPLNSTVPPHEASRLSAQHAAILDALREGPKTNLQLALICQRFSARLHELRKAGHEWSKECLEAGVYLYTLTTG